MHPSFLHTQLGDQGEYRRKVQSNVEDAHVAILDETPDVAIHRGSSGPCAVVQRLPSPQHQHGSVTCECGESRRGVTAFVRSRR